MTLEEKTAFLATLDEHITANPNMRYVMVRPPREIAPTDGWKRLAPGNTLYVFLAIGPGGAVEDVVTRLLEDARE